MRTSLIWLSVLTLAAPLAAQEINAPEPRWSVAYSVPAAMAGAADEPEQGNSAPGAGSGAVSTPIAPSPAGEAPPEERHHHKFIACAPNLALVDDAPGIPPLSPHEKFRIFYRQLYNPCLYAGAAFGAGIGQARNSQAGYGQGAEGYGKRVGSNLADAALVSFFGRAFLPTLLHDDPRYFRYGPSAGFKERLVHAALSPEWTRRDNGTHRFNYSRILGIFMASSVSNAYFPENERGVGHTFKHAGTMIGESSGRAAFEEFWPDIKARLFKKHKAEPPRTESPPKGSPASP